MGNSNSKRERNEYNSADAVITQFNKNAYLSGNFEEHSNQTLIDNTIQEMYDLNVEIAKEIIKIANTQDHDKEALLIKRLNTKNDQDETRLNKLEATLNTATDGLPQESSVNITLEKINKIKILNIRAIALMTTDLTQKTRTRIASISTILNDLITFTYVHVPMGGRIRISNKVFKNKTKNKNKKRKYSKSRN